MDVNQVSYQAPAPTPGSREVAPAPPMPGTGASRVPETAERAEVSDALLRRAVSEINSSIGIHRRHLDIRHHEASNRVVVTVYDSDTNEVVREIPPERVLEAHVNMLEMVGIFVNTRT